MLSDLEDFFGFTSRKTRNRTVSTCSAILGLAEHP